MSTVTTKNSGWTKKYQIYVWDGSSFGLLLAEGAAIEDVEFSTKPIAAYWG